MRIDENGVRHYSSVDEGRQFCDAIENQGLNMNDRSDEVRELVETIDRLHGGLAAERAARIRAEEVRDAIAEERNQLNAAVQAERAEVQTLRHALAAVQGDSQREITKANAMIADLRHRVADLEDDGK